MVVTERRVIVSQFTCLAQHKLEGMEDLIAHFFSLIDGFKRKRHDLLDFQRNDFDRDYVEFNVKIAELETRLQMFINTSFESITSIEHSLNLLRKFQTILQRESLRRDLDDKFNIIFQARALPSSSLRIRVLVTRSPSRTHAHTHARCI